MGRPARVPHVDRAVPQDERMPAELTERLADLFRWIDPGPGTSHLVSDISGWWRDPAVLAELGPALVAPYRAARPTVVLAPAVTGLLLGPLAATALGVGFVAAHKPADGRLPAGPLTWAQSPPDYRGRRVDLAVRGPAPRPRRPGAGGGRLGASPARSSTPSTTSARRVAPRCWAPPWWPSTARPRSRPTYGSPA